MRISGGTANPSELVWEGTHKETNAMLKDIADHSKKYDRGIQRLNFIRGVPYALDDPDPVKITVEFEEES